jgi:hypothetical protein
LNNEQNGSRARAGGRRAAFRKWTSCYALLLIGVAANTANAAIAYVQSNWGTASSAMSVTVAYTAAQTAGNLNVVAIGWEDSTHQIQSVTDTKGNVYAVAKSAIVISGSRSLAIYYAKNVTSATAGANAVTVTFNGNTNGPDIRILEYSGIDPASPLDVSVGASGSGQTHSSGPVMTTNANDLLVAANDVAHSTYTADSNFTQRLLTDHQNIVEDRVVTTVGSYSASAWQDPSGDWIMEMVAFKAAGSGGGDTQAPTAPANRAQPRCRAPRSI